MGGCGSGRWGYHSKAQTVEMAGARLHLDRAMADTIRSGSGRYRLACNAPSQAGALGALLGRLESRAYRWEYEVIEGGQAIDLDHGQPGQPVTERIAIARRNLTYGERLFWLCPGCSERAAILYRRAGLLGTPARFRCRKCHGLTYRSAQEADARVYRLVRAIDSNPAIIDTLTDNSGSLIADMQHTVLLLRAHDILMKRHRRQLKRLGIDV